MKRIAYLAPEIPAFAATFVYNEILELKKRGHIVFPISLNIPSSPLKEGPGASLSSSTIYLYEEGILRVIQSNISTFLYNPLRYLIILITAFLDCTKSNILSRKGIGILYRFFAASHVAFIIKKKKCEHVHANFAHTPTDIAMYSAMLANIPFSFTSHANDLFERGWLLPQKVSRSKFAITISNYNKKHLVSVGGLREKIHVIHCGVDTTSFSNRSNVSNSPPFIIGTLGRMVQKKGFDVLLRATSILYKKNIPFQLLIAGNGPLENSLKQLSKRLGIESVIKFIGPIAHENVPSWLKGLHLFVLPCKKDDNGDMDGIPVVLMEAMISGVPVISTKISGIPELIEHKKEGLLVEQKSPEELSSAIQFLLNNFILRQKYIANGINKVKNNFEQKKSIQMMIDLIEKNTA